MRREVHEEKCGIQYCSGKARFVWPGDARAAAKIPRNADIAAHGNARGFHGLTMPSA
jgi:hypothetical protein